MTTEMALSVTEQTAGSKSLSQDVRYRVGLMKSVHGSRGEGRPVLRSKGRRPRARASLRSRSWPMWLICRLSHGSLSIQQRLQRAKGLSMPSQFMHLIKLLTTIYRKHQTPTILLSCHLRLSCVEASCIPIFWPLNGNSH